MALQWEEQDLGVLWALQSMMTEEDRMRLRCTMWRSGMQLVLGELPRKDPLKYLGNPAILLVRPPSDGDCVRAVIRATAVNHDGRKPHISAPRSGAQEELIRKAYRKAAIERLEETGLFECHGTGTAAGDVAETRAVARVKPNVGHSEGASGVTSVIKAVLALEHKMIPPNVHFVTPSPDIPFEEGPTVPIEPTPWPVGREERVSVSSFGVGGTNAHVILDSASSFSAPHYCRYCTPDERRRLIVCSARSEELLTRRIEDVLEHTRHHPDNVQHLAYTLGARREHIAHRGFLIADGGDQTEDEVKRAVCDPANEPEIVFVFTGQGAQWIGMGRELWTHIPAFRKSIERMDAALEGLADPPTWSIQEELLHLDNPIQMSEPEISQALSCAVQIGLLDVLATWDVRPTAVIGHSSGEIAAAYAVGAFTADTAIMNAYQRGRAVQSGARHSRIAAVNLNSQQVKPYLRDGLTIACENSPTNVTISGNEDAVRAAIAEVENAFPDSGCRLLRVPRAFHCSHMEEVSGAYAAAIKDLPPCQDKQSIPLFSTVTGTHLLNSWELNSDYWQRHIESPVLFSTAVTRSLESTQNPQVFLEIGPHSALSGPLKQIIRTSLDSHPNKQGVYIPTLTRLSDQHLCLLRAAGHLHIHGAKTPDGTRLYDQFVFTDVSSGFLEKAKDRFAKYPGITYSVLDITRDPALHATPILSEPLKNVSKLLAPGGRFFLQEICSDFPAADYIWGLLPGWWAGVNDDRSEKPNITVDRWRTELAATGLPRIDYLDYELNNHIACIVASPPLADPPVSMSVGIMTETSANHKDDFVVLIQTALAEHGYDVRYYDLGNIPPPHESLKTMLLDCEGAQSMWVTHSTQSSCDDPRYGVAQGLFRSLRREMEGECPVIVEVDVANTQSARDISCVYRRIRPQQVQARDTGVGVMDGEYAIRDGVVHVPRLYPVDVHKEITGQQGNHGNGSSNPMRLVLEHVGLGRNGEGFAGMAVERLKERYRKE